MQHLIQFVFYNNPDHYPPIINSTKLLVRAGWKVEILSRMIGVVDQVSYPPEALVYRFGSAIANSAKSYLSFALRCIKSARPEARAFVGHDMHGLLIAWVLARWYRRPLIYHCHDFAEDSRTLPLGSAVVRWVERRVAQSAAIVIVPDIDRGVVVKKQLKLLRDPLIVANAPLLGLNPSNLVLRKELRLAGYQFDKIIFRQGRIGPGHAIESTLRSIKQWTSPTWGFVVMGPAEDDYVNYLNSMATELGVENQFAILPPVSYDHVARYTFDADLGHALYEPTHINNLHITTASNKLMEYLQAGLPVLVSDRPALARFVSDHQCGMSAEESSPESIALTVNTLLADSRKINVMAENSRRCFIDRLCYDHQLLPLLAIVEKYKTNIDF